MPDRDDELELLHDADPVDSASVPSPTGRDAVALFERITMADPTTAPSSTAPPPAPPRRHDVARLAAAAGIAVVALAIGAFALTRGDGDDDTAQPARAATTDTTEAPTSTGAITPGGPTSASCVEVYSLATLATREVAFDGTVVAVDGDEITLAVDQWFTGGEADEVTLRGASTLAGGSSAGEPLDLESGARLLVAGDGGFAWSCGFTQPYDPAVADQWAGTFG